MSSENQKNTFGDLSISEPVRNESLAAEGWLEDFLAAKGFSRISAEAFSNGKATLCFDGKKFTAQPGSGDKAWTSNLEDADHSTIQLLLEQILKMRPFLSDAQLADERIEMDRLDRALAGVADTIKDGPDTHSGVQLRRFLWSLYNGHHLVNLWRMTCVLDSQRSAWISDIFAGAFVGLLTEAAIKRALSAAGEIERWDHVQPSSDDLNAIIEAERAIESVLRTLPPSRAHTELKHARDSLLETQHALRRANESPEKKIQ